MRNESIVEFLIKHSKKNSVSFHMPGHKGGGIIAKYGYGEFLDNILGCDITEISGADNLFQPESIIKQTMDAYKKLYDVKYTNLLVNGSSCGLVASILSIVKKGDKLIMARNSHKSIFNAVSLGDIKPVYARPEFIEEYGILGEISKDEIKRLINANSEAKAVILPSPNYYGICSDIASIAKIVHDSGMILIIDQAHGAHLKFYDETKAAENLEADIVVNSTHKTLLSFTESAIVNVCSDRVDIFELEDKIQAIESTSPSYILMASLDINEKIIREHGEELFGEWKNNIEEFYAKSKKIKGLSVLNHPMLDNTKINLDMSAYGLNGASLETELIKRGIYPEMVSGNLVMCMSGIGNTKEDYVRLLEALKDIADKNKLGERLKTEMVQAIELELAEVPVYKEKVLISEAEGRTVAESVIPYLPGIPIACPGEILTKEVIEYAISQRKIGYKVIGIDSEEKIFVGK